VRWRWLPPVAAPSSPRDLLRGLAGIVRPGPPLVAVTNEIRRELGVDYVWLVSSGRAALTIILQALATLSTRVRVVVPAYTCFSVPAAVARAGLQVVPCDLSTKTLDFAHDDLEARLAEAPALCVVSAHLFGVPADVSTTAELCKKHGAFLVEDAAQAFGFQVGNSWLGTLADVGFYSFGRGKTVSAGGGGAIVCKREDLASAIDRSCAHLPRQTAFRALVHLAEAALTSLFVRSELYGIPARLPFPGLGVTRYSTDFEIAALSGAQAGLLRSWRRKTLVMNQARARNASVLSARLTKPSGSSRTYLRLPVLCRSGKQRDRLCRGRLGASLGFSPMYPSAVGAIAGLGDRLTPTRCPKADLLAERLMTVPVHPLVRCSDLQAIARVLDEEGLLLEGLERQ